MKQLITLAVLILTITACSTQKTSSDGYYGDSFEYTDAITIEQLKSQLNETQPLEGMIVKGTVVDVCQKKGCWMTLKSEDGSNVRVTFKDYGFFVPKDCSGKEVVLKGKGQIEITEVDVLKHFAEDEGQSQEEIDAITEPMEEHTFEAEGVKIN